MTLSDHLNFRKIAAVIAAAGTLFWIYTLFAIGNVPRGDTMGFELVAGFLLCAIFGIFFLPAWLLVGSGRLPRFTTAWGLCGLIAFALLWIQLLQEFPKL